MAARLNNRHQDMVRAKIQTSHLIRVLQDEALGRTELEDGQRESARFLINKSLGNPPEQTDLNVSGDISLAVSFVASRPG
jgi:hypothetical protein